MDFLKDEEIEEIKKEVFFLFQIIFKKVKAWLFR
jgi:hypothetical protein